MQLNNSESQRSLDKRPHFNFGHSNMALSKTAAHKSASSVFVVRSLLFLLLINPTTAQQSTAINQALDLVNGLRSAVAPPASDMRYMEWSPDFAAEANELAKSCEFSLPKPGVMYLNSTINYDIDKIVSEIVKLNENAVRGDRCKSDANPLHCRFYRDLMEAGADRIGCDGVYCNKNSEYLYYCVTNARSSDEPFNGLIYTRGRPCQMCPPSAGYCYLNLCVSNAAKTAILTEAPSSIITCNVPCVNCEERKEANNTCSCQSSKGRTSELDCLKGSGSPACSACRIDGTPCQNGGREAGGPSALCRCLCHGDYTGQFCEIPIAQIVGGQVGHLQIYFGTSFPIRDGDKLAEILKQKLVVEIDSYCRKDQANYLKCCGSGTLPIEGPMDFVDANSVHVTSPVLIPKSPYKSATIIIYATAKGNNGLCRKRTSIPPPIVAVPPEVIRQVVEQKFYRKTIASTVTVMNVIKTFAEYYNVSMPQMNYISLRIG